MSNFSRIRLSVQDITDQIGRHTWSHTRTDGRTEIKLASWQKAEIETDTQRKSLQDTLPKGINQQFNPSNSNAAWCVRVLITHRPDDGESADL